jgi:hypothetical protein
VGKKVWVKGHYRRQQKSKSVGCLGATIGLVFWIIVIWVAVAIIF